MIETQFGAEGRVIYQVGPDPSGLAAPFYPIRSLLAAVLQLPPVSSEEELRDTVLGLGLNERDIPGIAQLFGHPTTLLELEPPVRRREMVWSALRALERVAVAQQVAIVCEDVDRFDSSSVEILRRATESGELALPAIIMTTTPTFAEPWPAGAKRLMIDSLEASDLDAIVQALTKAGVRGLRHRAANRHCAGASSGPNPRYRRRAYRCPSPADAASARAGRRAPCRDR